MQNDPEKEFQRINDLVDRVFKPKPLVDRVFKPIDPEDEAFEELEKSLMWRKRQISAANGPEAAFQEWSGRSHSPQHADVERTAFMAGWRAAKEQQ